MEGWKRGRGKGGRGKGWKGGRVEGGPGLQDYRITGLQGRLEEGRGEDWKGGRNIKTVKQGIRQIHCLTV